MYSTYTTEYSNFRRLGYFGVVLYSVLGAFLSRRLLEEIKDEIRNYTKYDLEHDLKDKIEPSPV